MDAQTSLYYFMSSTFQLNNYNYMHLEKLLSADERLAVSVRCTNILRIILKIFFHSFILRKIFDMKAEQTIANKDEFVLRSAYCLQKNVLKEKMDAESKAKVNRKIRIINYIDKAIDYSLYSFVIYKFILPGLNNLGITF